MGGETYLSISEFSKISGVNRKKLIYYDNIDLFKPALVKRNRYRLYAHWQVETITAICILTDLGMPLDEIRRYLYQYGPHQALNILQKQVAVLNEKIETYCDMREMLRMRISMIEEGSSAPADTFQIVRRAAIPIFLSSSFRHSANKIPDEEWAAFYNARKEQNIPFCAPVGHVILQENLLKRGHPIISHLFSHVGDEKKANGLISEGKYLVGYGDFHYGNAAPLYEQMYTYMAQNHLKPGGNAYEEYILDELIASNTEDFRVKLFLKLEN